MPFEDQFPDLRKVFFCRWIVTVLRTAEPDAVFVQLDPFRIWEAEYHTSEFSVSDRQRFFPHFCRGFKNDLICGNIFHNYLFSKNLGVSKQKSMDNPVFTTRPIESVITSTCRSTPAIAKARDGIIPKYRKNICAISLIV